MHYYTAAKAGHLEMKSSKDKNLNNDSTTAGTFCTLPFLLPMSSGHCGGRRRWKTKVQDINCCSAPYQQSCLTQL